MNKIYVASIVLILNGSIALGQGGVVSAPVAEMLIGATNELLINQVAAQGTMNTTVAALEKAEKGYKEAMKQATWMRNMETAARILYMIENLVCTSKNLSVRMGGARNGCLVRYRFDMMIAKIQMSADYIGIVLAGVSMTTAERMKTLDDVLEAFEESQEMMVRLNKDLDEDAKIHAAATTISSSFRSLNNHDRRKRMR